MFHDIVISQEFISEFDRAPRVVCDAVDRKLHRLALEHTFRPGDNYHRLHGYQGEFWSIYITAQTAGAWRAIVQIKEERLYLLRLLNHRSMELEYSI